MSDKLSRTWARVFGTIGVSVVMSVLVGCRSEGPVPAVREIYSAVLKETVLAEAWAGNPFSDERKPIGEIVILDQIDPEGPTRVSDYAVSRMEGLEASAVADFASPVADSSVAGDLEGVGPFRWVSLAEVRAVLEGGWSSFYELFPGSPGLVAFSPVGFNEERSQAVVHMLHVRQGTWADGSFYLVVRGPEGWEVVDRVVVSES